jgi:glycosyltransferase involved in cell wall biosynthesis
LIRALSQEISEAGCDIDVATTDDHGRDRVRIALGVGHQESGGTYRYFRRDLRFYTVSISFARWMRKHVRDYDIVHVHALFSFPSMVAAVIARREGIPYVLRPLGTLSNWSFEVRRPRLKWISFRIIEKKVIAGAAAMHFTSDRELAEARKIRPLPRPEVIPNPVLLTETDRRPPPLSRFYPELAETDYILFLSRLDDKKGLDLLLEAFALIHDHHSDLQLVIAGEGIESYVSSLRAQANHLGISNRVTWTGFAKGPQKFSLLQGARVFVLPSHSENFGIAAAEALALGVPVVVSDQVGLHPFVAQARAGLVTSLDIHEVAGALTKLIQDESLRREMGANARRLANSAFSPKGAAQSILSLYEDILAQAPIA